MTPITPDYQRRAAKNYISKMAQIALVITPEQKEDIKSVADSLGVSMTAAILTAWQYFKANYNGQPQQEEPQ